MHHYGRPIERDDIITLFILTISLVTAFSVYWLINVFHWRLPYYVEIPSTCSFLVFWYWAFNEYLWKTKLGMLILGKTNQNYNGKFRGVCHSNYQGGLTIDIEVRINQSNNRISIIVETERSVSQSISANLLEEYGKLKIHYDYRNEVKSNSKDTMHSHKGFGVIEFEDESKNTLIIEYFNNQERSTAGKIIVKRII